MGFLFPVIPPFVIDCGTIGWDCCFNGWDCGFNGWDCGSSIGWDLGNCGGRDAINRVSTGAIAITFLPLKIHTRFS